MPRRPPDPRLRGFARSMRKEMTEAEFRLWSEIRGQKVEGLKFRRQIPIGPFIVDFFCPAHGLIVEIDGGQHFEDEAIAADRRRTAWLQAQGYRVLRFTNADVRSHLDGVCRVIVEALAPGPGSA
jgi:very-short-patch-repair endonuclease